MNLSFFSLKVGFLTPKVFRKLRRALATRPSGLPPQDGLKHARRPNVSTFGFPRLLKLLWLKPPFARKIVRFILLNMALLLCVSLEAH
jgi:hypothetical protein